MIGYFSEDELKQLGFKSLGTNVKISRTSTLYGCQNISIGNNVRIDNFCVIAMSKGAQLVIGNYVQICAHSFINGMADIIINDFVGIGCYGNIISSMDDFSGNFMTNATLPIKYINSISEKVILKKHVLVGVRSTILPGVILEEGVAVAGHSFVNRSQPEFTIIGGTPAKFLKSRSRNLLNLENKLKNDV